jgi:signal transduction histidine kinase
MALRTRLTLWYTGVLAVTLLAFGVALYLFISYTTMRNVEKNLEQTAREILSEIRVIPFFSVGIIDLPELSDYKSLGVYLQTNRVDGAIDRSDNLPEQFRLPFDAETGFERARTENGWYETYHFNQDAVMLIYHARMVYQNRLIGVLQVGTFVTDQMAFLANLRLILLLLSVFTLLLAATLGYFLARKALRPIDMVRSEADQIEKGEDLARRIPYNGPNDELGKLTATINNMLARLESAYKELEEAYRKQRRFVSDASHELRTPLTTIRGNIELLEKMWQQQGPEHEVSLEAMKDISTEAQRMSRLVSDLLALARADAGLRIDKNPVEMREVLDDVVRKAEFLPRNAEFVAGDLSPADGVLVNGNRDYIEQVLFILIDNAFKYTNEGFVELSAQRMKDQLGVRVRDTGIGMDPEEVPQIFERFYRADTSRGMTSGTGLGLSIAKWIIDEHGGSIEVFTRKNRGSTFVLWFPIHQPEIGDKTAG